MKRIIIAVVIGSLVAGTVAWYATGVYARGGRGQGLNWWPGPRYGYIQMLETRAQIFAMTKEELQKELNAGKTISEIAKEKGIPPEEFHQRMLAAQRERLENLVKGGLLTQEQLEARLRVMEQHYADCDCDGNCDGTPDQERARERDRDKKCDGACDEDSARGSNRPSWGRMGRGLGVRWTR